jgi:two-component system, OmpR family, sensor kinase
MSGITNDAKRWIETLERLLAIPTTDLRLALNQASDLLTEAMRADKVDAFLYEPARDSLVAVGRSAQPLSEVQRKHGLDVLAVANGGRAVQVFQTATTFASGQLDADPDELRGIKDTLKVRSTIGVPLAIGGNVRGLMLVASQQPDFFNAEDVRFMEAVVRWIAVIAHRAELMQEIASNAAEQGRQAAAEELITILAHDLRNYIAPIRFRLELMQRRAEEEGRDHELRESELALKGLARLGELITDLLDAARIQHGIDKIELHGVQIVSLLRDAAAALSTPEQPVTVQSDREFTVLVDPARIRQLVDNLLSNAIQHSPKNAGVSIFVSLDRRADTEWVQITVVDQGPGVPHQVLPHIFGRFVRANSKGLGLGLYLAKRIATAHGGDLSVESQSGKGTQFTLRLPCHRDSDRALAGE